MPSHSCIAHPKGYLILCSCPHQWVITGKVGHVRGGQAMGTATSSTSVLAGTGRNSACTQWRTLLHFPLGASCSTVATPLLSLCGTGRREGLGVLGVLQMRCSHSHRPDLCPILPTPKGAMRNRVDVQCGHQQILDLLQISATGTSVASSRVAAWGMELLTAAR